MSRGGGTRETDQVASPSAFPYQAWLSRPSRPVWPLVVATTSLAAFPALGAGGPRRAVGKGLRPCNRGWGQPGSRREQGRRPLPFSGCPSRLDFKSDTSGMSMRVQSRGRAPPRGSGCGCSGGRRWRGCTAQTPNPTRRVAAPSPRTARPRDPAAGPGKFPQRGGPRG